VPVGYVERARAFVRPGDSIFSGVTPEEVAIVHPFGLDELELPSQVDVRDRHCLGFRPILILWRHFYGKVTSLFRQTTAPGSELMDRPGYTARHCCCPRTFR